MIGTYLYTWFWWEFLWFLACTRLLLTKLQVMCWTCAFLLSFWWCLARSTISSSKMGVICIRHGETRGHLIVKMKRTTILKMTWESHWLDMQMMNHKREEIGLRRREESYSHSLHQLMKTKATISPSTILTSVIFTETTVVAITTINQ